MRRLRAALGPVVLGVAASACSSSSASSQAPPVVDIVEGADTVKAGQALPITVKGHDDDDNIVTVKVHLVASGIPTQDPPPAAIPAPSPQVGVVLTLVFNAPSGTKLEYDVTMVDAAGAESAPFKKDITIQ